MAKSILVFQQGDGTASGREPQGGGLQVLQQHVVGLLEVGLAGMHQYAPLVAVGLLGVYLEVLAAVAVQTVEQQAHTELAHVYRGLVGYLLALFVSRYLMYQVNLLQLEECVVDQPEGDLVLSAQLRGGVGGLVEAEALDDARGDEDGDEVTVAAADVARVLVETEVADVLAGVGELRSEEADGPRHLHPEQEQRQGGKAAVDGVVARHPHLSADVEVLEELVGRPGQDARDERMAQLHLRIGHEDVERRKHAPGQHVGDAAYQEFAQRCQQGVVAEVLHHRADEDGETARQHNQDGHEQQHRQVVGGLAIDAACLLHLPDVVERGLHVVDQHQHRPEQHHQAHADEDAVLRLGQVGVDEAQDVLHGLRIASEALHHLALHQLVEAESPGDGKDDGQYRHDGQQRAVGQRRGLVGQAVLGEVVDAEVDGLDHGDQREGGARHLILRDAPDVVGEKFPELADASVHWLSVAGVSGFNKL